MVAATPEKRTGGRLLDYCFPAKEIRSKLEQHQHRHANQHPALERELINARANAGFYVDRSISVIGKSGHWRIFMRDAGKLSTNCRIFASPACDTLDPPGEA